MYIANERLKVGEDCYREMGDPIPEAEGWAHSIRQQYLDNRRILNVPDAPAPAAQAPARGRKGAS